MGRGSQVLLIDASGSADAGGNRGAFKLSKEAGLFPKLVSANVKVMATGEIIRPWRTPALY